MRFAIYYKDWVPVRDFGGMKTVPSLVFIETVIAADLVLEVRLLRKKYTDIWIKPLV